jgi:hypothetical protein
LRKNTSSLTSSLERKKRSKKQAGNRIPKDQASKCKKTETDQRKRVPKRKDMIKIVKSRGHERDAMAARLRSHSLYIASSCSSCFCNLPFPHKASDFALHPSLPQPQLHAKRIDVTTTHHFPSSKRRSRSSRCTREESDAFRGFRVWRAATGTGGGRQQQQQQQGGEAYCCLL